MYTSLHSEVARASVDQKLEHLRSRQFTARTALSDGSPERGARRPRFFRARPHS